MQEDETRKSDGKAPLDGVTVIELGLAEAGQYCGRLLADLGARVITVEPLGGVATRRMPPFIHDAAGRSRSTAHEYLNAGKESIALDLADGELEALLRRFEGRAELLLYGSEWAQRLPAGLAIASVATSLYGAGSPRAGAPSNRFTRFQSGGSGSLMPTPRPAAPGVLAGECFAGAGLAMSVLGMLLMRLRTGDAAVRPSHVDHSEQAHFLNLEKMFIGRISQDKAVVTRASHRYPFGGAVRCKDGFVSMLINEKHQWKGFCDAISKPEWSSDERFATGSARFRMKQQIEEALHPWCAARTRREVVDAMRGRQVPIGSVNEVAELVHDPALRARGMVRDASTPYGRAAVLGLPFGADPLWRPTRRAHAPLLGEHTDAVLRELGLDAGQIAELRLLDVTGSEHARD